MSLCFTSYSWTNEAHKQWVLDLATDLRDSGVDAIHNGADGYLLKDIDRNELVAAIIGTAGGKSFIDPSVAGKVLKEIAHGPPLPPPEILERLTDNELKVLRLHAKGMKNNEIATALNLSEGTVRNNVSSILSKLGVSDRTQAAVMALRFGLVE